MIMAVLLPVSGFKKPEELTRFTLLEHHMGIDARIILYAPNQQAVDAAGEAAFQRIADLEAIMSDYRKDSELMRLCAAPAKQPVKISKDLFIVLEKAQGISKQSNGAFDVTVGPLVQLWRKARKEFKLPEPTAIESAKNLVGYQKLTLNREQQTAELAMPGMKLDLGGIAKGYAADEAMKMLQKHGIKSALIEMGGDILVSNAPPKSKGWKVLVPNREVNGVPTEILLSNCAISTSGDTEQYVTMNGIRYSHVVDPKTGAGLTDRIQSTIIAPDGLTSDPLSTAVTILSDEQRKALLKNYPKIQVFIKRASN